MYYSRKIFATYLRNNGVEQEFIDYCRVEALRAFLLGIITSLTLSVMAGLGIV
jgi:hypothetical protein